MRPGLGVIAFAVGHDSIVVFNVPGGDDTSQMRMIREPSCHILNLMPKKQAVLPSDTVTHELVRTYKTSDVWTDQFGYTWTKNSYGTWYYLEGPAHSTGTACTDVNNRLCNAFAEKMAGHTALMEQLRDAEYGADVYGK